MTGTCFQKPDVSERLLTTSLRSQRASGSRCVLDVTWCITDILQNFSGATLHSYTDLVRAVLTCVSTSNCHQLTPLSTITGDRRDLVGAVPTCRSQIQPLGFKTCKLPPLPHKPPLSLSLSLSHSLSLSLCLSVCVCACVRVCVCARAGVCGGGCVLCLSVVPGPRVSRAPFRLPPKHRNRKKSQRQTCNTSLT
jgi:hypothetical protein